MRERLGGYIQVASGRQFWPLDPRAEEVDIGDIAQALSNICRFTGHVRRFYSVAQHCVLVSQHVEADARENGWAVSYLAMWGLLHDAAEAYVCDIARPVKHLPALAPYREAEDRVMRSVCEAFNLNPSEPAIVKHHDRRALRTEQRDLMPPPCPGEARDDVLPWVAPIEPWSPTMARSKFLDRFEALAPALRVAGGGK